MSSSIGKSMFNERLEDFLEDFLEQYRVGIQLGTFFTALKGAMPDGDTLEGRMSAPLLEIYEEMHARTRKGMDFAEVVRGYVPTYCQLIIESSQAVGQIDKGLEMALMTLRGLQKMREVVIGASMVPIILTMAGIGLITMFGLYIVPQFIGVLPLASLGPFLRMTVHLTGFVTNNWLIVVPVLISLLGWMVWSFRNFHGPARRYLDIFPPWSIYRLYTASYFLIILSSLMRANMKLGDAFLLLAEHGTPYERYHIELMREGILSGGSPADAMDTGLLSPKIIQRLKAYELSNKLEYMLSHLGSTQLDKTLKVVEKGVNRAGAIFKILFAVLLVGIVLNTMGIGEAIRANMYK